MIYNLIIPTHRKDFLIELLKNLETQIIKPDRIILIIDIIFREEFESSFAIKELITRIEKFFQCIIINSHLTSAINAFKNCFIQMEVFTDINKDNYFQIIEDDVRFFSKGSIKYIKNYIINNNPEFLYVKLIDILNNKFINTFEISNKISKYDKESHSIVLDTCGMIFKFNKNNLNKISTFNKIIKDLDYTLIADAFALNYFTHNLEFNIIEKICIISNIHKNQISAKRDIQLEENSIQWKFIFKKYGINNKNIKYDVYAQFVIRIISVIKECNIELTEHSIKPTFGFIRKLYKISISNSPSKQKDFLNLFYNNLEIITWIYKKSLEIDKKWLEVNPFLKLDIMDK